MEKKVNIVADICCNHQGNIEIAEKMISTVKECGADYVKLQKRCVEEINEEKAIQPYAGENSFGKTYGEHRSALEFSYNDFCRLLNYARDIGIGCFATPFDITSLEQLVALNVPYIKLGSAQVHNDKIIEFVSKNEMPSIIMSTGMCDAIKVFNVISKLYNKLKVVMQTTSAYPCHENYVNINVINYYKKSFPFISVGLSGHYVSGNGAIEAAAVAMGATWIERHFTLDRTWKGTDHACSLEPEGLLNVVKAVRTVERAMGSVVKEMLDCEKETWGKISR